MFTAGSLLVFSIFHLIAISWVFSSSSLQTDRVCSSIDIRNRVEQFVKLENCTIVEGNLQIVLIENAISAQFEGVSFPRLRQITGYLLVYRVYGLRSLARMFPNLAVIRGQTLFHNYAIVIFENNDIYDLGLQSLKRVLRGAIRIEKNAHLCYLDSIDWSMIMSPDIEYDHHFIFENGDPNQCFNKCPSVNGSKENQFCSFCWNQDYCQIVCPPKCESRDCYIPLGTSVWHSQPWWQHDVQCCHKECIGGCTGPNDTDCVACAHFIRDGRCYARCPQGMYEFRRWRCVTESECKLIGNFHHYDSKAWKVLESGQCLEDCPPETVVDPSDPHRCIPCEGRCPKVCTGIVVDNIAAAQKLKGCTVIVDVLDIQMRGAFAEAELEENLGMIEEVTGYMQVAHSHTITSLRFMKSLRLISGQRLHSGRFSLTVFDNQNLQEVWNAGSSSVNLKIAKGAVYFHFNPKLCLSNINQLVAGSNLPSKTNDSDISLASNGDQVACDVNLLSLEIVSVTAWEAVFQWQNANLTDNRQLLSWVINYRKTSEENITVFNAKDVCGTDVWTMIDIKPSTDSRTLIEVPLYGLEPFTKYAVYIQMYTISTAQSAAMSPIKYFTTSPSIPSSPRNLVVTAKHSGQLHISWLEPSLPNGIVTHYNVYWRQILLSTDKFMRHNFCIEKLPVVPKPKTNGTCASARNVTISPVDCCSCPKSKDQQLREDEERRFQIEFENFLHDSVYRKKPFNEDSDEEEFFEDMDERRRKRSFSDLSKEMSSEDTGSTARGSFSNFSARGVFSNFSSNSTEGFFAWQEMYKLAKVLTTEHELTNLNHFQEYTIEVEACHDYIASSQSMLCSERVIASARTLPNGTSDALKGGDISIKNNTQMMNSIVIRWSAPQSPNGLILLYKIELVRVDVKNYKPDISCVTHAQFLTDGGYVTPTLASGNWSVRMHAMSLAGDGPWTEYRYFYVARFELGESLGVAVIIGIVFSGIVLLLAIAAVLVWYARKRLYSMMNEDQLYVLSSNPHYGLAEEAYISDEWEIPREKIEVGRELGQGSFGMVHEGVAKDVVKGYHNAKVAIKTVNPKASIRDRISFLNEASVMKLLLYSRVKINKICTLKQFDCHHVVKLIGIVSSGWPTLVVMELMANGDLKNFLRRHRPDEKATGNTITFGHMLQMAGEIADGMAYLASLKFVHRDLAARNCMVSEDLTVKVGDFGMARDIYGMDYYKKGTRGLLPVRWMAPESLKDGIFNTPSDVWSYGVVLWEMATLAAQPYQGMANEDVLHYVIGGGIMDKTDGCPNRLYDMMLLCWRHNPSHRPTFIDIVERLVPELSERFSSVSYFHGRNCGVELEHDQNDGVTSKLIGDLEEEFKTAPEKNDSMFPEFDSCQLRSSGLTRPAASKAPPFSVEESYGPECPDKWLDVLPLTNAKQDNDKSDISPMLRYRTVNGSVDDNGHSEIGNDLLQLNTHDYSGSSMKNNTNGSVVTQKSSSLGGQKNGLKNGRVLPANNLLATTAC